LSSHSAVSKNETHVERFKFRLYSDRQNENDEQYNIRTYVYKENWVENRREREMEKKRTRRAYSRGSSFTFV